VFASKQQPAAAASNNRQPDQNAWINLPIYFALGDRVQTCLAARASDWLRPELQKQTVVDDAQVRIILFPPEQPFSGLRKNLFPVRPTWLTAESNRNKSGPSPYLGLTEVETDHRPGNEVMARHPLHASSLLRL
jgi:hypothetical protein